MTKDKPLKPASQGNNAVGYKKPPAEHRFKKGQSGNPKGRPKGAKNKPKSIEANRLEDLILEEAYRQVQVPDGERMLTMPVAQLATRSLATKAAKGDHRSQKLLAELIQTAQDRRQRTYEEKRDAFLEYKRYWTEVLRSRERQGLPPPDPMPLPHPDDMHFDRSNGEFGVWGPVTEQDMLDLKVCGEFLEDTLDAIDYFRSEAGRAENDDDRDRCLALMAEEEKRVERFLTDTEETARAWPNHWPPKRLRDRLPPKWAFGM